MSPHDDRATERWINEGGRVAPDDVLAREMAAAANVRRAMAMRDHATALDESQPAAVRRVSKSRSARPRVVIVGGGVAGLESLLALHALAGDRVDITLVEPELKFVNRSMAVMQPFKGHRVRGVRMEDIAAEFGARWLRRTLDRVAHEERVAITKDGVKLPYDMLVLAIGARRPERSWPPDGQLTFYDGRSGPDYRLLLHQLREGRVGSVAFVRPAGVSWPLPLYDLALLTAADCAAHGRSAGGRTQLHHPGTGAARDLRQGGQRGHPGTARSSRRDDAYEQLRRPGTSGLARHLSRRSANSGRSHRDGAASGRAPTARRSLRSRRVHPHRSSRPAARNGWGLRRR